MDNLIVVTHIVCGAVLFMTAIIMQLVTGPALSRTDDGEGKRSAQEYIQKRWMPFVDGVIILLTLTALYLIATRMEMIGASLLLTVKVTLGATVLTLANLMHFYWRNKKRSLKESGDDDAFKNLSKQTAIYEKMILTLAPLTFLLGVIFNHG